MLLFVKVEVSRKRKIQGNLFQLNLTKCTCNIKPFVVFQKEKDALTKL